MVEPQIQREYVRIDNWSVAAKVCKDEYIDKWQDVRVSNIAAGGLLFLTELVYNIGVELHFDLSIDPLMPGFARSITMKVKGVIRGDRGMIDGLHAYSVGFTEISRSNRVRLDELIRMTNAKLKCESVPDFLDR